MDITVLYVVIGVLAVCVAALVYTLVNYKAVKSRAEMLQGEFLDLMDQADEAIDEATDEAREKYKSYRDVLRKWVDSL